jgi:tetratricopeptide (TPR) repeat protein
MAVKTENTQDPIANVEDALSRTELFIEKNRNVLFGILAGIIVIVGGFLAYKQFIVKPNEAEAQTAMFRAENYFEKDSFQLALNGKDKAEGFLSIIENYGNTPSGNLAHFYAGICYLQTGKYQEAIDQLDSYSGSDLLTTSMALGAKGDALMELGKTQDAIDMYAKAAGKNENGFSSPIYLMKAALAYEGLGNYEKAIEIYKKVRSDFYQSNEGRESEKYIARAESIMQQKAK